jgi:hypothetical protein
MDPLTLSLSPSHSHTFLLPLSLSSDLGIGDDMGAANVINIAAVLFMWSASPAFAASGYLPSIVLERGLYVR